MIILGLDPGLASTGFGLIKIINKTPNLLKCGYIKTDSKLPISNRLSQIYSDITSIIKESFPDIVAIENAYSLIRYPKAGILLGCVLGIIYVIASINNIRIMEITPKEVKSSLTGYGNASKNQIKKMVQHTLNLKQINSFHASDALAIALTAYYRTERERPH